MRGEMQRQQQLFSYVSLESRIPPEHPLREIKRICDEALKRMCSVFDGVYSETGRPSIPPERLLKAQLLIALYSLRSDRMFCERLNYDLLFRWFLDMTLDESTFVPSVFSKNRERLIAHEVGKEFLDEIVQLARSQKLLSDNHFSVDGSLIESVGFTEELQAQGRARS